MTTSKPSLSPHGGEGEEPPEDFITVRKLDGVLYVLDDGEPEVFGDWPGPPAKDPTQ